MRISILIVIFFSSFSISAQEIQGIATYISKKKVEIKLDTTKYDLETRNKVSGFFTKQFEKTFQLTFNNLESNYKEAASLDIPKSTASKNSSDLLYKNLKDGFFVHRNEFLGKNFLIRDSIPEYKWKIGKQTKHIGNYLCYNAKSTIQKKVVQNKEVVLKNIEVEAWFTLEIPIGNGPNYFNGLPGLILEVNDGTYIILCSKIILNPDKEIKVRIPKTGKEVTLKEFEAIELKKIKEGINRGKDYLMGIESDRSGN